MRFVSVFIICLCLIGCRSKNSTEIILEKKYDEELRRNLATIKKHRIYFGHMSVGENILEGLQDLYMKYDTLTLNIINLHQTHILPEFYFAHSFIGDNSLPESKCNDFSRTIEKYLTPGLEYAFMKFCFVDIDRNSNITAIFELYKNTIDSLHMKYPKIKIIHFTVPLISHNVNSYIKLKRFIKKVVGRRDYSPLDNIERNAFNELLHSHFKDEPIFDIARIESTYLDGTRELFSYDHKEYPALISEYTDDAGHLNKLGRQVVAIELVKYLAAIINQEP